MFNYHRRTRRTGLLPTILTVLLLSCGAGHTIESDAGTECSFSGIWASCDCPDGAGLAVTFSGSRSTGEAYLFATTCIPTDYESCRFGTPSPEVLASCQSFCDVHRDEAMGECEPF